MNKHILFLNQNCVPTEDWRQAQFLYISPDATKKDVASFLKNHKGTKGIKWPSVGVYTKVGTTWFHFLTDICETFRLYKERVNENNN